MVVHLLVLGRFVPHQCTSGHEQVGARGVESFVHQEIFLLPTQIGNDFFHVRIEVAAYVGGRFVYGMDGLFQGSLVVERLAGIRDENRGNHQGVAENEDGRSGVPGRIAARFERGADAPVGERRGIGFLLDELLAGKFFHHAAFAVVFHKSIMFLGRAFGERLEPVCTVGHAQLHGPFLHTGSHDIGRLQVERRTVVYHITHLFIYVGREIFEHLLAGKYIFAEEFGRSFGRGRNFYGFLLESFAYNFKS